MQRINWIDWVKAWCMTVVVFDHTPHDGSPFLLQFLAATNLSSFFFISGYLKKPITSQSKALKKYAYCLLIPYLIYNAIFYPYWLGKTYIEQDEALSLTICIKPILGTILGQLNSSSSCELNGVTWFLLSLFIMHWITDICNQKKNGKFLMISISLLAIILYGANKYYHFAPYLTFHGLVRCICFFFMGNVFRQSNKLTDKITDINVRKELVIGLSTLIISLLLFYWHIHEERFVLHILLYYVVNLFSVYAIIHLCRSLNNIRLGVVTTISIGTMLIFGVHRILIGIIDYAVEKSFHLSDSFYDWYECILLALIIELILLPIILWSQKHCPLLLGKRH